ncbi:MAG: hypothetical protein KJ726_07300 [Verrucomicrobia bacterium]|nr:hypothetical protein [Verrucomicrobiota bacterium]
MDPLLGAVEKFRSAQKAEQKAEFAAAKADSLVQRIERLEKAGERLAHLNRAIWEILSEAANLTEQDLKERLKAIAAEQTAASRQGKLAPPCPKCHRPLERGRDTCVYCGAPHDAGSVFDILP